VTVRTSVWLLFAALVLALPLPMLGLDGSVIPPARYVQLALVMLGLVAHEGTGGMVGMLVWLFVAHAVIYVALLGLAIRVLARPLLARMNASGRRIVVVALSAALLVAGSFAPLYRTQFHHDSARAGLLELYR
jgi:hypothetical protein